MIISASRRSDIPAFYSRWFMNRIEAGFVLVANPFNSRQIRRIRLRPDAVEAIVFWTRHAAPLLPALPRLEALGYRSLFHVTLTGYPSRLEPHLPPLEQALASFLALSRLLGPERVIWRYDPILLCNWLPVAEHQRRFSQLAAALAGHTRQVVISFADLYGKSVRQLDRVPGLQYQDLLAQPEPLAELLSALQRTAAHYDLQLSSCAEAVDLSRWQIAPGRCIDVALLNRLFGLDLPQRKDPGQRAACGCAPSVDIGQYDSCPHGCAYCYANRSQALAARNRARHDPASPLLLGDASQLDPQWLHPEPA